MSASSAIQDYYCAICDRIVILLKKISISSMAYFELVGSLRCAAELSRMGRKKESRNLLISANKLRELRRLKA